MRVRRIFQTNWADRRFERRYLKWLAGECEKVSLIGVFAATPGREPRLSQVFVVPALSERRERRRLPLESHLPARPTDEPEVRWPAPEEWTALEEAAREETRPVPLSEALRRRTAAILGEPGAGKSTLLRYLALAFARKHLGDPSLLKSLGIRAGEGVPVLLPLRECATAGCSLTEFAETYIRRQTRDVLKPPPRLL